MSNVHLGGALRQIQRLFAHGCTTGLTDSELLRRFEASGDSSAFSGLVARHGPMVLSVCRGVVRDELDAEDAFQATFLVLVRRAGSVRVDDSLGGWLHRVAFRVATRVNSDAIRRRSRERSNTDVDTIEGSSGQEADPRLSALHEEIDRLPESHRRALVLCLLEGKTQAQAAQEIGCGEATVRRRLAGARDRLRNRLDRRGQSVVIPPLPVVPAAWVEAVVRVASAARVSSTLTPLAATILAGLARDRFRRVASILLTLGLSAASVAGVVLLAQRAPASPAIAGPVLPQPMPVPDLPQVEEEPPSKPEVEGVVVGPDGKGFAGATVFLRGYGVRPPTRLATTEADGRFHFNTQGSEPELKSRLIAIAPGFGFGIDAKAVADARAEVWVSAAADRKDIKLKLVADDPVTGRVVDREGKPVAGARIRVRNLYWPKASDLEPWLAEVKRASDIEEYQRAEKPHLISMVDSLGDIPGVHAALFPPRTTDLDGRFRFEGLGKERVVEIIIDGPGLASSLEVVATRWMEAIPIPAFEPAMKNRPTNTWDDLIVYGDVVNHVAGAGRVVEGVVTERVTGKPIAGLTVHGPWRSPLEYHEFDRFQSPTDAEGRYRIEGLPVPSTGDLTVTPPEDQPYLGRDGRIDIKPGPGPFKADITLRRGVWITGRVFDEDSGEPLQHGPMHYYPFADNSTLLEDIKAGQAPEFEQIRTDDQGNFRVVGYPGRGIVTAWSGEHLHGVGADKIVGLKQERMDTQFYPPYRFVVDYVNSVVEVNPAVGSESVTTELKLKKGKAREVLVVGPDGEPVSEIEASGLRNQIQNPMTQVRKDRFPVTNLIPGESREVVARLVARKLMGMAVVTFDGEGPVTLKLQPWANLTGRLVDDQGQPRIKSVEIRLEDGKLPIHTLNGRGYDKPNFSVDADGRFRIEGLVPGARYDLELIDGGARIRGELAANIILKPGESRDLGDLKFIRKPK